jgi:hypothetical protein
MINDEEKYNELRKLLKSAPRVSAKADFEKKLFARIKTLSTENTSVISKKDKQFSLTKLIGSIFRPSFTPAYGFGLILVAAISVYLIYFINFKNKSGDSNEISTYNTQGEFIIYMKKDNNKSEISTLSPDELKSLHNNNNNAPYEPHSDYMLKHESPRPSETDTYPDRYKDTYEIETQKLNETGREKGVDAKEERKTDDAIMKRDTKTNIKGEMKKEGSDLKKSLDEQGKGNENTIIKKEAKEIKPKNDSVNKKLKKDSINLKPESEAEQKQESDK